MFGIISNLFNVSEMVKEQIIKIFVAKAKDFKCAPENLLFVLDYTNGKVRVLPLLDRQYKPEVSDKEIEEILTK